MRKVKEIECKRCKRKIMWGSSTEHSIWCLRRSGYQPLLFALKQDIYGSQTGMVKGWSCLQTAKDGGANHAGTGN